MEFVKKREFRKLKKKVKRIDRRDRKSSRIASKERKQLKKNEGIIQDRLDVLSMEQALKDADLVIENNKFRKIISRSVVRMLKWLHKHHRIFIGLKLIALTVGLVLYYVYHWNVSEIINLFWIVIQYCSLGLF